MGVIVEKMILTRNQIFKLIHLSVRNIIDKEIFKIGARIYLCGFVWIANGAASGFGLWISRGARP